jgi:hypothetical protein
MARAKSYKVWIHIEGLDSYGDCIEGDEYHEPQEAACVKSLEKATEIAAFLLEMADSYPRKRT